jgi:hypothetical protein
VPPCGPERTVESVMNGRWRGAAAAHSMQEILPIPGHQASRSRHGLIEGVMPRRGQNRTIEVLALRVVPEPVFVGLVALDDGMTRRGGVAAGVLTRRGVAAADMTAVRTSTEVEPPATGGKAFEAAGAARWSV